MTKKIIIGIVGVLAVVACFFYSAKSTSNVGGSFNPVRVDFAEGISVDGTTIISGSGALTPASLTTSGTLAVTGGATIGNTTTGLNAYSTVLAPAADTTLTVAQTGSIVKMAVAGLDVTLPTPASANGVHYRFVVSGAVATTDMTIVSGTADKIEGTLIVAGAVVDCDASDIITFVIDGENIGDFVDLYSDGSNWLIGESGALTAAKMTCTG